MSFLESMWPFERVVRKLDPAARLVRAWTLHGGISAQMTALEFVGADGERRKVIVRRPGAAALRQNANAAADEFRILQIVHAAGVKAQRPYLLDTTGEILPEAYLVLEYIEGETQYAPADAHRFVREMAAQLAQLHTVGAAQRDLAFLPQQAQTLASKLATRPSTLDHALEEGRIRDALERAWPLPLVNRPVLLHGDFWPGNLLWQDGALVAVIDWEDAQVGDPLADFATTRLDVLWLFGLEAMLTFTHHYRQLTHWNFNHLPYWDLVAALRPASRLSAWAEGWPNLGRADITEATMRAGHRFFVEQAFRELEA